MEIAVLPPFQLKQQQYWHWDKGIKIGVAALAVVALLATFLPESVKWLEVLIASLAVLAAVILNVVPVGEWMMEHAELFRSWSDLLLDVEQMQIRTRGLGIAAPDLFHPVWLADSACRLTTHEQSSTHLLVTRLPLESIRR
jgi:hypothetical protein